MNIIEKIKKAESVNLEFKEKFERSDTLAKLLVAFSNTKGGEIIVGVEKNTKKIKGVDTKFSFEEWVMNIATNNVFPVICPIVELHNIGKKLVALIKVHPGRIKPYYVKKEGDVKGVYYRVGSTLHRADENLIKELSRESINITFDKLEVVDASIDNIDLELVRKYLAKIEKKRQGTISSTLLKLGVVKKKNGFINPTIGGLLFFGKTPQQTTGLDNAIIKFGIFGKDRSTLISQKLFDGTLAEQIENSELFFCRLLESKITFKGFKRFEQFEYPIGIIRELIVNAVAHRNYFIAGTQSIKNFLYPDSIQFESPGYLPEDVNPENIYDKQVSRNPWISRILFNYGYMEEWGTGLNKVKNLCIKTGLHEPIIIEGENCVRFVIQKKI